jgi:hypothetical protein
MQEAATKPASAAVELKDARLFREACYVDGQWVQAKSGAAINVDNPATGEIIGRVRSKRRIVLFQLGARKQRKSAPRFCAAGSI